MLNRLLRSLLVPIRIPVGLVGVLLFLFYIAGAPIAMHLSIRWPAPYWFAIGLNGFGISLLIGAKWRHVIWSGTLGIVAACMTWFAEIGAYHVCHFKQAYRIPWSYLLKIPSYLCFGLLFFVCCKGWPFGIVRGLCAAGLYLSSYLVAMLGAETVCNIALPRAGTMMHGNYDILGYRLGMYSLFASFFSALLVRFVCFRDASDLNTRNGKA